MDDDLEKEKKAGSSWRDYINLKGADAVDSQIGRDSGVRVTRPTMPKVKGWRERADDKLINQLVELEEHDLPVPPGWALLRHHNPEDLPDIGRTPTYDEYVFEREQLEKKERLKKGVPSPKKR